MVNYSIWSVGFIKKLFNLRRVITMKKVKKLILILMISVLSTQLCLSNVFAETSTKIEGISYNNSDNFDLEIKDSE